MIILLKFIKENNFSFNSLSHESSKISQILSIFQPPLGCSVVEEYHDIPKMTDKYEKLHLGIVTPMANEIDSAQVFVETVLLEAEKFHFQKVSLFTVLDNVSKDGRLPIFHPPTVNPPTVYSRLDSRIPSLSSRSHQPPLTVVG